MYKINPKDKFMLFKQNNKFCAAPWSLLFVYPNGRVTTCAEGTEILGNLNTDTIEEILDNNCRKNIKGDMLNCKTAPNCMSCLTKENYGNGKDTYQFLRNNYNTLNRDLDINYFDKNEFVLGALDLHWSSLCDLKCVTCWAEQSSSIAKEQGLPTQHLPSDRAHMFIDWIVKNQATLREIYLSGGEPTLIKYNQRLLAQIKKRDDLQIRVNSNLMWDQNNSVLGEVLKFPNVLITCSADSTGEKFEYIRRDSNWNTFIKNLQFLQSHSNVKVRVNIVFSVMSATSLTDTIDYFKNYHDITDFTINQCGMGHTYLRPRNLPITAKQQCRQLINQSIEKYFDNVNLVGQLNNCIQELNCHQTESYCNFLDKIDQLAGTSWQKVFKELA